MPVSETLLDYIERVFDREPPAVETVIDDRLVGTDTTHPTLALVKMDPVLQDVSWAEFEDALIEKSLDTTVSGLLQFYPDDPEAPTDATVTASHGSGLLRVSGRDVPDAPRHYRAFLTGAIQLAGEQAANNWAVAHFDADAITGRDAEYLRERSLFTDTGENRLDEVRSGDVIIDSIKSGGLGEFIDAFMRLSESEREAVLDDLRDEADTS